MPGMRWTRSILSAVLIAGAACANAAPASKASVVARARDVLTRLEDADRKNPASQLIDDLPLFQVAVRREEVAGRRGPSKVEEALKALDLDDLTPRAALDALYELKKTLNKAG